MLGSKEERLINAVHITLHISYWLQQKRLTANKLALYLDEE